MMTKRFIILIFALIPFISGCEKENNTSPNSRIRAIAWNSLSEQEKSTLVINWQVAPVTETTYQDKISYAVSFNTSDDALLGPIIIYIDKATLEVLGKGLRM